MQKKTFFSRSFTLVTFLRFFHVLYFPQLFKNRNVTVHRLQDPFSHTPPLNLHIYIILSLVNLITAFVFQICNPHSSTFLFLSEGQQLLFPSRITLSLESASQKTSPAYWSWRLITLIWSHTRQFVISFITTVIIHYSSLPLQAQNSSFP